MQNEIGQFIAKRLYQVAFFAYITFVLADLVRPGFVSHVFSVHWFAVPLVVGGVLWLCVDGKQWHEKRRLWMTIGYLLIGVILAIGVWRFGAVFGDMRIFLTLVAAQLPLFGYFVMVKKKK